jgi:hypothetical protein
MRGVRGPHLHAPFSAPVTGIVGICMLHVFHLNVAMAIHVCCKCIVQMFELFHLDIACFHLDVAYVVSVCFKCFTCFRHMLQVFYLNVTYVVVVIHICCKCKFQFVSPCFSMLQQVLLSTRSDS